MYSRILVPLDGSPLAEQALPYARLIAGSIGAEIVLFQAVPELPQDPTMRGVGSAGGPDRSVTHLRFGPSQGNENDLERRVQHGPAADLEQTAARLREVGLTARAMVAEGDPAEAIAAEAGSAGDTLIVMTTHGRSGILRWWAGSITDKTVRASDAPMLVIRCGEDESAPEAPEIRRIILPLDGSDLAEQAIPHAAVLAKAFGARVNVLRALSTPMYMPAQYPVVGAIPSPGTESPEEVDTYLDGIVERLRVEGAPVAEVKNRQGDAASVITETAESAPDSLVVMSTHGRSGIGRWVLGSVADKVVRHSGRPVLLVRAQDNAARQAA